MFGYFRRKLAHINGGSPRSAEIVREVCLALPSLAANCLQTIEIGHDLGNLFVGSADRGHHGIRIMPFGVFDLPGYVFVGSPGTDTIERRAGRASLALQSMTGNAVKL